MTAELTDVGGKVLHLLMTDDRLTTSREVPHLHRTATAHEADPVLVRNAPADRPRGPSGYVEAGHRLLLGNVPDDDPVCDARRCYEVRIVGTPRYRRNGLLVLGHDRVQFKVVQFWIHLNTQGLNSQCIEALAGPAERNILLDAIRKSSTLLPFEINLKNYFSRFIMTRLSSLL